MTSTVDDLTGGTFTVPANPPIPATLCRVCKSAVTDQTICRECLYGPRDAGEAQRDEEETEVGPINPRSSILSDPRRNEM